MKRCPTCNRTYADEALTFCLADGTLLSAPYDPQATEVFPKMQTPTASPPQVSPSSQSPAPLPQRNRTPLLYAIVALLFLIAGLWWVLRSNKEPQSVSSAANSSTVTSPTPAPEQTKDTVSKSSSPTPTPAQQPSPVVMQAPTATPAQNSEEVPVRFILGRFYNSTARVYGMTSATDIVYGSVQSINREVGAHVVRGSQIMVIEAVMTRRGIPRAGESEAPWVRENADIYVDSLISGTIVKVFVKEKQRIYTNEPLLIIRPD